MMAKPAPAAEPASNPSSGRADSAPSYSVVQADLVADREQILALWRNSLALAEQRDGKYRWSYEDHCAAGTPIILFALHGAEGGTPIGTLGLGPRRMQAANRDFMAGVLGDFAVEPAHRSVYPALLLQKEMRRRSEATFPVLFGFPNKKSEPVVRRVGYRQIGDLTRYVYVLRTGKYLPPAIPKSVRDGIGAVWDIIRRIRYGRAWHAGSRGLRHEWLDRPDRRFDELWARQTAAAQVMGFRDRAFLDWRFVRQPDRRHRFLAIRASGDTALLGYAVCESEGETLHLRDMLVDPHVRESAADVLRVLIRLAGREGYASLSFEVCADIGMQRTLARVGMIGRGSRPVVASIGEQLAGHLRGREWFLTCADEDE